MKKLLALATSYLIAFSPAMARDIVAPRDDESIRFITKPGGTPTTVMEIDAVGNVTFSSPIVGDISGNASTVTNGVYTTGDQTIAGTKTFTTGITTGRLRGDTLVLTAGTYDALDVSSYSVVRLDPSSGDIVINGLVGGITGQMVRFIKVGNTGANSVTFTHSSSAAIAAGSQKLFMKDGTSNDDTPIVLRGTDYGVVDAIYSGNDLRWAVGPSSIHPTVVRTTDNQTIAGTKTFSSPIAGDITGDSGTTSDTSVVRTTTAVNTGSGLTGGGTLSTSRNLSVDSTVIRTTGNQSMSGEKTFSTGIRLGSGNPLVTTYKEQYWTFGSGGTYGSIRLARIGDIICFSYNATLIGYPSSTYTLTNQLSGTWAPAYDLRWTYVLVNHAVIYQLTISTSGTLEVTAWDTSGNIRSNPGLSTWSTCYIGV